MWFKRTQKDKGVEVSIHDVTFNTDGWTLHNETDQVIEWRWPERAAALSKHFFPIRPDIPVNLSQTDTLIAMNREQLKSLNGSVVEVSVIILEGVPSLMQIFALPIPQQQTGRIYIGSITLPFAAFSYVLKAQFAEVGMTGIREALLMQEFMTHNPGDFANLQSGPFPPEVRERLHSFVNDPRHDVRFPDHPLSRVRQQLAHVRTTVQIAANVKQAPPFVVNDTGA